MQMFSKMDNKKMYHHRWMALYFYLVTDMHENIARQKGHAL